jgi:hypothetical protein
MRELAGFAPQTQRMEIKDLHGIGDTGAKSVFIQEGVPGDKKQPTTNPLTVNLPDGRQVKSTHTCNIVLPGLHCLLLGHIVPNLAITSLFGICPLCNAGCIVVFDKDKCTVLYDGKIILTSRQNLSTDLWTLPFRSNRTCNTMTLPPTVPQPNVLDHPVMAEFMHSVRTRMNAVQFAPQLLGNPHISTLYKAVWLGFLNGCPNISEKLVLKYLSLSPATAKGHIKRQQHGIRSTTSKIARTPVQVIIKAPVQVIDAAPIELFHPPLSVASNNAWDDMNVQPTAIQPMGHNIIFNKSRTNPLPKSLPLEYFPTRRAALCL